MKLGKWILSFIAVSWTVNSFAGESMSSVNAAKQSISLDTEALRRAYPAPFDSIFPMTEYIGPTIGVPNTDPVYPFNKMLWNAAPGFKNNDIRIYGWLNPSYNLSTSSQSNSPLSYNLVPNRPELNQFVIRIERQPNTVQADHIDWGFRISNLYGTDYRYTIAQGFLSNQLLQHNYLYGYDMPEAYAQLYFPHAAEGMVVTIGRYISPADIEAQLSPQNFLLSHSLMFSFDGYTQTGVNTAIKFNNQWTVLLGIHAGNDVVPTNAAQHVPTALAMLRWISKNNNNSLWGGVDAYNGGGFKGNHDNLQQFNLTWSHRFTEKFFTLTEAYYIHQTDAAKGGTCNFGPQRWFGGGGGCGPIIPGKSSSIGAVNYTELKVCEKDFISARTDYLNDVNGQRSGYATQYMSFTLGLTHQFNSLVLIRPELRYEFAFKDTPYNNGRRQNQTTAAIDTIVRF